MKGIVKVIILLKNGKCIKDMNRYCPSISRTYNNLEYDTGPNGCNETETEKIRKYLTDYNNNPPNDISVMTTITNTSGRLHSEFVRILFS